MVHIFPHVCKKILLKIELFRLVTDSSSISSLKPREDDIQKRLEAW